MVYNRVPIYSFANTGGMVSTDKFVILSGLVPKLVQKSVIDGYYAPTFNPIFTGTVTLPDGTAASRTWVNSRLNSANVTVGIGSLDQALATKVNLAGVLTGSITNPTLSNSGVVAGTYNNCNITVGADGRITAASSNAPGGGTLPAATTTTAGVVRIDSAQSNPVVYTKDSADSTFVSRTVPSTQSVQHTFSQGLTLGTQRVIVTTTKPSGTALWFEQSQNRAWEKVGDISYDLNEKNIDWYQNVGSTATRYVKTGSNSQGATDMLFIGAFSSMFRYTGYDTSNYWTLQLTSVDASGVETTRVSTNLVPSANPWTHLEQYPSITISRNSGLGTRLIKVGNPGNIEAAVTIQIRAFKP